MTTIYFVRHAHSTYTPDELTRPLSAKGEEDVGKVTQVLTAENIDLVVSSPYKRAIQTVQGIANHVNQEIIRIEDLRERRLASGPVGNFKLAMTKVWEDPTFAWEGGESNVHAQRRGVNAIKLLLNQYEGKNIALGTHGNIMVLILNYFDDHFDFSFWGELDMPDVYKVTFENQNLVSVHKLWT